MKIKSKAGLANFPGLITISDFVYCLHMSCSLCLAIIAWQHLKFRENGMILCEFLIIFGNLWWKQTKIFRLRRRRIVLFSCKINPFSYCYPAFC